VFCVVGDTPIPISEAAMTTAKLHLRLLTGAAIIGTAGFVASCAAPAPPPVTVSRTTTTEQTTTAPVIVPAPVPVYQSTTTTTRQIQP
jgi:hypothetical protein